jgi:hypothetical protein
MAKSWNRSALARSMDFSQFFRRCCFVDTSLFFENGNVHRSERALASPGKTQRATNGQHETGRGSNEVKTVMATLHNTAARDCGGSWFCLINACQP